MIELDVAIFGGGGAGLWLLDTLRRTGARVVLLESRDLGTGQTISAQGIIHGGLKYTLRGALTPSARAVHQMPGLWRDCLAGRREPNLSATRLRSDCCYLWQTRGLRSAAGMVGARVGLQVRPEPLPDADRPAPLARCPGAVYRLPEQVIDTASFLENLRRRNAEHLLKIDADAGLQFINSHTIRLSFPAPSPSEGEGWGEGPTPRLGEGTRTTLDLRAKSLVLTAGSGNEHLRTLLGLPGEAMQRRPLHQVMVRGENLPQLNGHCVDGAATRMTITADRDVKGRVVWQLGGQIAERGVGMDRDALIREAKAELAAVLPGFDVTGLEWATYCIDRAEAKTPGGHRPETVQVLRDANVLTAWPTKLALAPILVDRIIEELCLTDIHPDDTDYLKQIEAAGWPRPVVAHPPWETSEWTAAC